MTGPLTLIECKRRWRWWMPPVLLAIVSIELVWIGLMLWG
jgi:hypothetical protein